MRLREAAFFLFLSDFQHIAAFVGGSTRLYDLHATFCHLCIWDIGRFGSDMDDAQKGLWNSLALILSIHLIVVFLRNNAHLPAHICPLCTAARAAKKSNVKERFDYHQHFKAIARLTGLHFIKMVSQLIIQVIHIIES
jgi:hypothetical protein